MCQKVSCLISTADSNEFLFQVGIKADNLRSDSGKHRITLVAQESRDL